MRPSKVKIVSQLKHNIDNIDKGLSGPYVLAGGGWACVFAVIVFVAVGGGTMGIGLGVGLVVAGIVAGGVYGKSRDEELKAVNTKILRAAFGGDGFKSAEVLSSSEYLETSRWLYEQCFEKFHLGGVRRPTLTGQQGSMIETGILVSSFEKKVTRMGDCYLKFTVNKREMYCKIPKKDDQEITQDDVTKAMLKTMAQEVINNKSKDSWVSSFGIWKLCGAKNQEA